MGVPEAGGPADPGNEARELVMAVFGGLSRGERNRVRLRVRTAMAAQARIEGRYLGARPTATSSPISARTPNPPAPQAASGCTPSSSTGQPH